MKVKIEYHDGSVEILSGVYKIWLCTRGKTITIWAVASTPRILSLKEGVKRVSVAKSGVIWGEEKK